MGFYFRLLIFLFWVTSSPVASGDVVQGADLKVAYIFNFAKFVEWPDREGSVTLQLCLFGKDDLEKSIKRHAGKKIQGRVLEFVKIKSNDDLPVCEILFVSETESRRVGNIISATEGLSILTISVVEGFAEAGGIINLMWVQNKLRFDVNKVAADKENIVISSRLLKLANKVLIEPNGR